MALPPVVGVVALRVEPSPKSHNQAVMSPSERSVKVTVRGAVPLRGETLKSVVGVEGMGV